jgi:hypothetical protein
MAVVCVPISHRDEQSFLCASILTYVVTTFMIGSVRCGSGAFERQPAIRVALSTVLVLAALQRYDGEPMGMSLRLLKFTGGGSVDDYAICRSS